ncbi:MAG TPA: TetR family transcriptional regulator [Candidatus Dormibacteraeota bacterium]|nr:TetR family transcriptional regulator [Candidatus Dormibacteraeota bacterium]
MRRRTESIAQTRRRIVEATVHLHGTLGPRATTVSAIAREAGVTRLTVYRHFPDESTLYGACTALWLSLQVPPDPAAWARIDDPARRLRAGLRDLYRFYRGAEAMLERIRGEEDALPEERRQGLRDMHAHHREILVEAFGLSGRRRQRVRALVGHAISFWTWRSLCVTEGLSDRQAADAMTALVLTAAGG